MQPFLNDGWCLVNSSKSPDVSPAVQFFGGTGIKPDMALYESPPRGSKTDSSVAELFGEFKVKPVDDPFYRRPPKAKKSKAEESKAGQTEKVNQEPKKEQEPRTARDTRGQITLYINAIQASQYRSRVFLFFIIGDKCRLFCHSRAGTQYTDAFYYTKSSYLHEFFWRLTHGAPAARGHDTTMRLGKPAGTPLYLVTVGAKTLYVHEPFTRLHRYPVGPATRCYVAYDPARDNGIDEDNYGIVLLKDCWRNDKYKREDVVYAALEDAGVCNVPRALASGDVGPEGSFSRFYYVGLSNAIRDALRDISIRNIVLCNGEGYLIDWERAKELTDMEARAKERTGTWEFMSIRLLSAPNLSQEIGDDLESFVYVVLHSAICFATNALTPAERAVLLQNFEQTELGVSKRKALLQNPGNGYSCQLSVSARSGTSVYRPPAPGEPFQEEIQKRKLWLSTHDWLESCFERYVTDPMWLIVRNDWHQNEIMRSIPQGDPDNAERKRPINGSLSQAPTDAPADKDEDEGEDKDELEMEADEDQGNDLADDSDGGGYKMIFDVCCTHASF
ncbi:hypothetical protein D9757_010322 [Collybiopsis confluens]|uniref:Fungal-type protein kinase domain-containing protein n=1 Tax=Collybiopsis confluens TaxID=2823264 RepID=A0A8H5GN64_9AGAR|nr:hypothetical protein D9757_010322 [Collybiopsis confluens]